MSKWNHSCCRGCWNERNPEELCCFCGGDHRSGVYLRRDPTGMRCHGEHVDPIAKIQALYDRAGLWLCECVENSKDLPHILELAGAVGPLLREVMVLRAQLAEMRQRTAVLDEIANPDAHLR